MPAGVLRSFKTRDAALVHVDFMRDSQIKDKDLSRSAIAAKQRR